jgi:hypothetical protein
MIRDFFCMEFERWTRIVWAPDLLHFPALERDKFTCVIGGEDI